MQHMPCRHPRLTQGLRDAAQLGFEQQLGAGRVVERIAPADRLAATAGAAAVGRPQPAHDGGQLRERRLPLLIGAPQQRQVEHQEEAAGHGGGVASGGRQRPSVRV